MPVSVSLELLIKTPGTQSLWPEAFIGLMATADEELTQNNFSCGVWAIIAGWCEEQEEHQLASAFFWLSKRPEVRPVVNRINGIEDWTFNSLPAAIRATGIVEGDVSTLAGAIAVLAERLRRVREALA
jgi:hypothetical protein